MKWFCNSDQMVFNADRIVLQRRLNSSAAQIEWFCNADRMALQLQLNGFCNTVRMILQCRLNGFAMWMNSFATQINTLPQNGSNGFWNILFSWEPYQLLWVVQMFIGSSQIKVNARTTCTDLCAATPCCCLGTWVPTPFTEQGGTKQKEEVKTQVRPPFAQLFYFILFFLFMVLQSCSCVSVSEWPLCPLYWTTVLTSLKVCVWPKNAAWQE